MNKIYDTLNTLRQYTGNAQIECLKNFKDDFLLKEILEYTYDTQRKYKIDEGKFNKFYVQTYGNKILDFTTWRKFKEQILDPYSQIKSAKDEHVANLIFQLNMFDEESQEILKMVIFKDLRLGMNAKKFQKVWPDFLITYPYMGCKPFNMKNLQAIEYPAFVQTKMDGTFCNVIVDFENQQVEYISRQSKPQPILGSLDKEFLNLSRLDYDTFGNKVVFTGELLVWDNNLNKPLPRKLSNGIIRRDNKTIDELNRIHFVCWDCIPYNAFIDKLWNIPYKNRFDWMKEIFESNMSTRLHLVNTWVVNTVSEAMTIFDEQYAKGEEGVVVKSFNQVWQDGKPSGQVKIKAEKDCDLQMKDFFEGKGLYSNMCGAIKCVSSDDLLEVMVKPRTPQDAQEIWDNRDMYMDKILTVKYNEKIQSDTKDKVSLYLPVFVEVRDDKKVADSLQQII